MKNKYKVQTGGKLYLAGEYAVLTPGYGAVIQFIPIYLSATIQEANTYQLVSDLFGYSVDLTPNKDYSLIQETIRLMEEWLKDQGLDPNPIALHRNMELVLAGVWSYSSSGRWLLCMK